MLTLHSTDFLPMAAPVEFAGDAEIHLWLFDFGDAAAGRSEMQAQVRDLLAGYVGRAAATIEFERDTHGKPHLPLTDGIAFNLSHAANLLLVAVARGVVPGVDVETARRPRDVLGLAQRFFAPEEAFALGALDAAHRQRAFLDLWTCKEAVLKALGRGLAFGLQRLRFDMNAAGDVVGLDRIDAQAGGPWNIVRLVPVPSAVGAVAWTGERCPVRAFTARRRQP